MPNRIKKAWRALRGVEDRQGFTDAIVEQILRQASSAVGEPARTAGVEIAAGVVGRAFASADVSGLTIPRSVLSGIGRDLIVRGEAVVVNYRGGIHRANHWDVSRRSDAAPHVWEYWVDVPVPGGSHVRVASNNTHVAHPRYASDPARPWQGRPPWSLAGVSGDLSDAIERSLRAEAKAKIGYLLPVPVDGQAANIESMKQDLGSIDGDLALVETTSGGWGGGSNQAPQGDWRVRRIGSDVPPALIDLYREAQRSMIAACGVPVDLALPTDGTNAREAWRRCLHGTLMPLARLIAEELNKISGGRVVTISFDTLMASDLTGRARAFQSMVGGGMDPARAAGLAGLMDTE